MNVILYNNKSDKRQLVKNIAEIKTISATAKGDINIISPTLIIHNTDMANINYCYITELKRYYFLTNYTYITGQRIELHCNVDVLMSYADDIKRLKVNVLRYEKIKPSYITDSRIPLFSSTKQRVIEFPDNIFNLANPTAQDKNFLLNIVGGSE